MKKILRLVGAISLLLIVYYLFIRPFEFEVNFKADTSPGDLIETIRIWNRSLERANIADVDSFSTLEQTIRWKGRKYEYNWHFSRASDSTTKVNIQIAQEGRGFLNKLLTPFTDQAIEQDAREIATEFYDVLKMHLKITRVKLLGESMLDSSFCACVPLETDQIDKARGMMRDFSLLTSFTSTFNLKLDGPPSVRISQWDHSAGLIKFDFCFPIVKLDSLPSAQGITYKSFEPAKVLKAEYHGNYITSDRAWYELADYAARNGYKINGLPIEFFYDNPTLGVNESEWKAEIFLPIK